MSKLSQRLRRLETSLDGAGRVIVVVWPNADIERAFNVKGIEAKTQDLIVLVHKEVGTEAEGWVSVDGRRIG